MGVEGRIVEVECVIRDASLGGGLAFDVVGLPEMSVRDVRVRARSAIRHNNLPFPKEGIVSVVIKPDNLRKEGTSLDLPLALAILAEQGPGAGGLFSTELDGWVAFGELSLTGALRGCAGAIVFADAVKQAGLKGVICASEVAGEVAAIEGIEILHAATLGDIVEPLRTGQRTETISRMIYPAPGHTLDFADVRGYSAAKRALIVAAAGGHNVLMVGAPGTGKTMLARRMPGIMPEMTLGEQIEVTKIWSVSGLLPRGAGLVQDRPFRTPHHTVSPSALVGGGSVPKPGEITLAHEGVLFLDELQEFPKETLQTLRAPMEDGKVVVTRAGQVTNFPAKPVSIVGSTLPCPCGHRGSLVACTCSPVQIKRYWDRLRGLGILDKFDIKLDMSAPLPAWPEYEEWKSSVLRKAVQRAWVVQAERYGAGPMNGRESVRPLLMRHSPLLPAVHDMMLRTLEALGAPDAVHRSAYRVARTIADLEGSKDIQERHMAEALRYSTLMCEPRG